MKGAPGYLARPFVFLTLAVIQSKGTNAVGPVPVPKRVLLPV